MQQIKEKLQQFCQELYELFSKRPDAILNLLDALSADGPAWGAFKKRALVNSTIHAKSGAR